MQDRSEFRTPAENAQKGIAPARLNAFARGDLSQGDMVILVQDVIEAGVIHKLDQRWHRVINYYEGLGWVRSPHAIKH